MLFRKANIGRLSISKAYLTLYHPDWCSLAACTAYGVSHDPEDPLERWHRSEPLVIKTGDPAARLFVHWFAEADGSEEHLEVSMLETSDEQPWYLTDPVPGREFSLPRWSADSLLLGLSTLACKGAAGRPGFQRSGLAGRRAVQRRRSVPHVHRVADGPRADRAAGADPRYRGAARREVALQPADCVSSIHPSEPNRSLMLPSACMWLILLNGLCVKATRSRRFGWLSVGSPRIRVVSRTLIQAACLDSRASPADAGDAALRV